MEKRWRGNECKVAHSLSRHQINNDNVELIACVKSYINNVKTTCTYGWMYLSKKNSIHKYVFLYEIHWSVSTAHLLLIVFIVLGLRRTYTDWMVLFSFHFFNKWKFGEGVEYKLNLIFLLRNSNVTINSNFWWFSLSIYRQNGKGDGFFLLVRVKQIKCFPQIMERLSLQIVSKSFCTGNRNLVVRIYVFSYFTRWIDCELVNESNK